MVKLAAAHHPHFAPYPATGDLMRLEITDLASVFLLGRISQLNAELPEGHVPARASRATKARVAALRRLMKELHGRVWSDLAAAGYDPKTCTAPVPIIDAGDRFQAALEWETRPGRS